MQKHYLIVVFLLLISIVSKAQYVEDKEASIALIDFERQIDEAVVKADMDFLQNAYADDFRFKHSDGKVDDKAAWLSDVEKGKGTLISRKLDNVEVEIHNDVGVTNGILTVKRKNGSYKLQYVRVYVRKEDQWQMIMHRSVQDIK